MKESTKILNFTSRRNQTILCLNYKVYLEAIQRLISSKNSSRKVVEIFFFFTHAIEFWETKNRTLKDDDFPQKLDRVYGLNYERLFGTHDNDFPDAKQILGVLCSSLYQIRESELAKILRVGEMKI